MKHSGRKLSFLIGTMLVTGTLTACQGQTGTSQGTDAASSAASSAETEKVLTASSPATATAVSASQAQAVITLSDEGVAISGSGAALEDGQVTISQGGTYYISGQLSDGCLKVEAEDQEVELILAGVDLSCSYESPIFIKKSSLTTITLAEGTSNSLQDLREQTTDEEDDHKGCIHSKSDLIIQGSGALTLQTQYYNGIVSKGDLTLLEGSLDLEAVQDAIHATGQLTISGGTYRITAGDDAIHTDGAVTITEGNIQIDESYEGIEGSTVSIAGGTISVISSDDGINAAGDTVPDTGYSIDISGGTVNIEAGGDGVDSNGSLTVSGGQVYIISTGNGDSALDYETSATITGGTVVAAGASEMAENFGEASTQGSILLNYNAYSSEDITLKDASGNVLVTYSPGKNYNSVVISCPSITTGNTYTVEAAGQTDSVTMDSLIYGSGMMGGGQAGPGGQMDPGMQGDPGNGGGGMGGGNGQAPDMGGTPPSGNPGQAGGGQNSGQNSSQNSSQTTT